MSVKLTWLGDQVVAQIAQSAVAAITEIDQRIETAAKAELYPGHGKRTGALQRAIQGEPGRREGSKVKGKVGVKGIRYALRIHKRYQYIVIGLRKVQAAAPGILSRHIKR